VKIAAIQSSDLPEEFSSVAECIAGAARSWQFPAPRSGDDVVVSYPFVLTPGEMVISAAGLVQGPRPVARWFTISGYSSKSAVVEVLGEDRRTPIAGVEVTLHVYTNGREQEHRAVTDERGLALFENLPSHGTVNAAAGPSDHVHSRSESARLGEGPVATILLHTSDAGGGR
jgi:hypothetical protein